MDASRRLTLPSLDAEAPWLAPWRAEARALKARLSGAASVAAALGEPGAVRFVAADALPPGDAYESFVARTRGVPTRDNAHDLFNGFVWCVEPALKARLNALHAAEIAQRGAAHPRGPVRDALTLFDEQGAWLDAPAALWVALRARDWQTLFIAQRGLWRAARLRIVGHALLEKLQAAPRPALTAHVFDGDPLAADARCWAGKPFCPLPVLGVPGWWPANEEHRFYDDATVFRPPRPALPSGPRGSARGANGPMPARA